MALPVIQGERLTLRPLAEDDLERLAEIVREPGVVEWWGEEEEREALYESLRMEGQAWAIEADGELAGWLGITEETDPQYPSVGLDIVLSGRFQRRGLGPEAVRTAIRWFADARGHHRFTIDPAAANERAIKAYASIGFRPVGVMRRYERGPDGTFRDGLLMDLLIEELV